MATITLGLKLIGAMTSISRIADKTHYLYHKAIETVVQGGIKLNNPQHDTHHFLLEITDEDKVTVLLSTSKPDNEVIHRALKRSREMGEKPKYVLGVYTRSKDIIVLEIIKFNANDEIIDGGVSIAHSEEVDDKGIVFELDAYIEEFSLQTYGTGAIVLDTTELTGVQGKMDSISEELKAEILNKAYVSVVGENQKYIRISRY